MSVLCLDVCTLVEELVNEAELADCAAKVRAVTPSCGAGAVVGDSEEGSRR
jgi:hypothetical protein